MQVLGGEAPLCEQLSADLNYRNTNFAFHEKRLALLECQAKELVEFEILLQFPIVHVLDHRFPALVSAQKRLNCTTLLQIDKFIAHCLEYDVIQARGCILF